MRSFSTKKTRPFIQDVRTHKQKGYNRGGKGGRLGDILMFEGDRIRVRVRLVD